MSESYNKKIVIDDLIQDISLVIQQDPSLKDHVDAMLANTSPEIRDEINRRLAFEESRSLDELSNSEKSPGLNNDLIESLDFDNTEEDSLLDLVDDLNEASSNTSSSVTSEIGLIVGAVLCAFVLIGVIAAVSRSPSATLRSPMDAESVTGLQEKINQGDTMVRSNI